MSNLQKIDSSLQNIDLTKLAIYTNKIKDIGHGFNPMLAPIYIRDFIIAYDIAITYLSEAIKADMRADSLLKQVESIAFLDNAKDYLKEREIKDSAEARKRYVSVDPDVLDAQEAKAKTTAVVSFLKGKVQEFRLAHDSVKKIAYADQYQTQFEGM